MFENLSIPQELIPSDPRFGVGPSLIPEAHFEAILKTGKDVFGTSHRKPTIINLVKEVQEGLKNYFDLPEGYLVTLGNGGATFLFDMIGLGLVRKASVHYTLGEFSTKWFKAHSQIPWISATQKSSDYGDSRKIEPLDAHDMICCTLNETSTGVMIEGLPDCTQTDTLVAVDATSGAGQIKVDFKKVDVYFFSPQKVFAADGGLFVAILSPKALKRFEELKERTHYIPEYMKWSNVIEFAQKNQTYNTPSIVNIFLLNEQIKLLNTLGEKEVIRQAEEKADLIYKWAEEKEYLSPFVTDPSKRSISVATIDIDAKYSSDDLVNKLRELKIVYDIEGYRKLGRNQLRIGLFHNIQKSDLEKLTKIISFAIENV